MASGIFADFKGHPVGPGGLSAKKMIIADSQVPLNVNKKRPDSLFQHTQKHFA